jgi:hypothetical protein
VTAAQLAYLAEISTYAADFYCKTDPDAAHVFGEAASRAEALSAELGREEEQARHGPKMPGVSPELSAVRSHPR